MGNVTFQIFKQNNWRGIRKRAISELARLSRTSGLNFAEICHLHEKGEGQQTRRAGEHSRKDEGSKPSEEETKKATFF